MSKNQNQNNQYYSRGLDIFNPILWDKSVLIIGAGGIGSTTAFTLAKMGINLTIRDGDVVEEHNCGSQFYAPSQVNQLKVEALSETLTNLTGLTPEIIPMFYDETNEEHRKKLKEYDIVILALDSIEARESIVKHTLAQQFIIDPRMAKQIAIVNTLHGIQANTWIKEQVEDVDHNNNNSEIRCTEKAIAFVAMGMASLIGSVIQKFAKGLPIKASYQLDLGSSSLNLF